MNTQEIVNQQVGQAIRKTINFIEQYGWVQGQYGSERIGVCVMGGICNVTDTVLGDLVIDKFSYWLSDILGKEIGITKWNDDVDRTKEEVLLYLNKFADEMDPQ